MIHRIRRFSRGAHALLLGTVLAAAAPLAAKEVYRDYLDASLPHHRAILDTLERLKKAPNDAGLHNDLGCLVAWDGFWRDALREFDTAAKLDRKDSRPLFNAGLVHAWRGQWGAAARRFSGATRRDPGNWPAWWMLGFADERRGMDDAAVSAYKKSLRVDTSLFEVAKNPFAADTRLKTRVLLETYDQRLVRASLPVREEFSDPDRIAGFFQKSAPAAPAGTVTTTEQTAPAAPTGPIITSAPPTAMSPPPSRPIQSPNVNRPVRPAPRDPNADQAAPPDNLPFNQVTPAPKRTPRPPRPGPGGGPPDED